MTNKSKKQQRTKINRRDGGRRYVIKSHPPPFVSAPWYNLVVRIVDPPTNITVSFLNDSINSQLGIGAIKVVRLQSVRFWGALAGGTSGKPSVINILVYDPIGLTPASTVPSTGLRVLEQLTDYPDVVTRACVGYHYPKAQREFALRLAGTPNDFLFATNGMGIGSVIYVNLQWRAAVTTPPAYEGFNFEDGYLVV